MYHCPSLKTAPGRTCSKSCRWSVREYRWLQPCSRPIRAPMTSRVRSLASGLCSTGCMTQYPVTAVVRTRNQARPAAPTFWSARASSRARVLAALGERYRLARLGPDVLRLWADEAGVGALLQHVGPPAPPAPHRKRGGGELFSPAARPQPSRSGKPGGRRPRPLRAVFL